MDTLEPKFNQYPKVTDFDKTVILAQQVFEDGFRSISGKEVVSKIKDQIEITGIELDPIEAGGATSATAVTLPTVTVGQVRTITLGEGWFTNGTPYQVIEGNEGKGYFNGTSWSFTQRRVKGDPGKEVRTEGTEGNFYNFENITQKGYYDLNGVIQTASQTYLTDFNSCLSGDTIEARTRTLANGLAIIIFDANKNFIRGVAGSGTAGASAAPLTTRSTLIANNEVFWRVASTAQNESEKIGAYAKRLVNGEDTAEEVTIASNNVNKSSPRTNVVVTELAVSNLLKDYNIEPINDVLSKFLPIDIVPTLLDISNNLEIGGIDGTGTPSANNQRIRTREFINHSGLKVVNSTLSDYNVYFFSSGNQFLGEAGWITTVGEKTHFLSGAVKTKMIFRNKASTNITPSDFNSFNVQVFSTATTPQEIATKKEVENGSITQVPFNINTKAKVVTNWKFEKMCHDGNLVIDNKGRFYLPYYASNDSFIELPSESGVSSRMSYWNVCDFDDISYFEMMKKGETVGSDIFDTINSPYVPAVFLNTSNQNHLLYLSSAKLQGDPEGWRMVSRYWNKNTNAWIDNTLHKCTLKYAHAGVEKTVQFSERGIEQMVLDQDDRTITNPGFQMLMARWKVYNGEYYTFFGTGTWVSLTNGYIVKTTDGINYTVITQPPSERTNIWEGAIEIIGDELFCVVRGRGYMWIYNLITNIWETVPNVMNNIVEQRMAMQKKDSYLYILHNITNVSQTGWSHIRNNVRVLKINPTTRQTIDTQEFASPNGFHYYGFAEYRGQMYCYFTQDLRNLNPADPKTNISVIAWEDLIKI